jgi:hypothetical protein
LGIPVLGDDDRGPVVDVAYLGSWAVVVNMVQDSSQQCGSSSGSSGSGQNSYRPANPKQWLFLREQIVRDLLAVLGLVPLVVPLGRVIRR